MQQTQTYKLNKPGVDDPITPVPLNENADKLDANLARMDAAIVATDGRHCLDKLLGPLSPGEGETELNIDLSGIDKSKYGALILFFVVRDNVGSASLYYNGVSSIALQPTASGAYASRVVSGGGFVVFFPGTSFTGGLHTDTGLSTSGDIINAHQVFRIQSKWEELESFKIKPLGEKSTITLYGLRA